MLILEQARKTSATQPRVRTYILAFAALGLSIPFGVLSAHFLQSWLAGLVLGASLFAYSILLAGLLRRQGPHFLKRLFVRKDLKVLRSINEYSGLRIDYIASKDPQDSIDGVVHNRSGELQRIIRCTLPQRGTSMQSLLFEMLFADLASFKNTRFQLIFTPAQGSSRRDLYLIASYKIASAVKKEKDEKPPLVQMQEVLDRLMERLLTLGIAPKILNATEVRQLISYELSGNSNRLQLTRDWRGVGNLGWEPSFRDKILRPHERYMQISNRKTFAFAAEQLPSSGSFEWLPLILADIPDAHLSIFITPWETPSLISKMRVKHKLKKASDGSELINPTAAQMSFYFRFDGEDQYELECNSSTARRYLLLQGITSSFSQQRNLQLQSWRATLPFAQEQKSASPRHLVAFMNSRRADTGRADHSNRR